MPPQQGPSGKQIGGQAGLQTGVHAGLAAGAGGHVVRVARAVRVTTVGGGAGRRGTAVMCAAPVAGPP